MVDTRRLRVLCQPYGVVKVDATSTIISISITFKNNPPIDAIKIIALIQKTKHIKLAGAKNCTSNAPCQKPGNARKWCVTCYDI
ncbi:MAG: hypothetical protein AUJ20_02805 [Comamonadaceae bacterium CG1_02_60_18]|nr:MAG: hypothetical protein AUJ20_02805 [Comamonadaceae bacterium CG1_02_60_18]